MSKCKAVQDEMKINEITIKKKQDGVVVNVRAIPSTSNQQSKG